MSRTGERGGVDEALSAYPETAEAREWDYGSNGKLQPKRDIDFTDHGYPDAHPDVPHQHKLTPNNPDIAPKGGYQRGPAEPLE